MTIQDLRDQDLILFECISGSKAYGLDVPGSDTDIRGVFMLPREQFYGMHYTPQVSDDTNDLVFYELGRFMELLSKNNPNILELLATPEDKVLHKHPVMDRIDPSLFLSKKCKDTFGGYAFTQVRKARGLKKKIVNPVEKRKKSILEFCYILYGQGSMQLPKWLKKYHIRQEDCGLVNIPHCRDVYALFHDPSGTLAYRGIQRKDNATKVLLSSVPKVEAPRAHLFFNEDGYVQYCRDYREYWEWVENRNEHRYQNNVAHGKDYDSKNMMHTFRLLDMAIEILREGAIRVHRPNREELLTIRHGAWAYEELLEKAQAKMDVLETAYRESTLPAEPDMDRIEALLVQLRKQLYQ
ncbi:nucleotidyltransferase [Flavilitoribacter nigricans DSM 23189 = NBRC 102662]|uniref:Nucleotidyltransferase n=1 Tax=Flavilitoribacter nigricans (strain ATCC 23147 / DSM 23189 / NBRC 102662 / NCIMB 1420 / SS-2) TaxID=1122177 RepID=A0A2D0N051_FLAN2|nr:nucleotidyltransferase [Flavilitoribacter nigricans DSM 23189 = NBRC 102662]